MDPAFVPGGRFIEEGNQRDEFIRRKMTELDCFYDIELWESFQEEFVDWTRRDFELASTSCCRAFRTYLRRKGVWISKETTSAKSLYDAFKEKTFTSWTEDEIKRSLSEMRFTSYLIKEFLKASSDEILQRQKHEIIIDHEEFMTERCILISESFYRSSIGYSSPVSPRSSPHEYSPPIPPRSFASSPSPLPVDQPIKHPQPENQVSPSPAMDQSIKHPQPENQVFSSLAMDQSIKHPQSENQVSPSLAISQGLLIIDNSEHALITEISEHLDGPSDRFLVEQSSFKPLSTKNQEQLVKRSDESSISSPSSFRSIAPPISVNQSGGQSRRQLMGQSMGRAMSQLMRRSMNQSISGIHVRCGVG
jgi:hypothetical protein